MKPPIGVEKALLSAILLLPLLIMSGLQASKVVEFGSKLPEFVQEHASKSWLIKFYAPWCHHCQQLETTYNNVAEKIYHKYDNLIVGRVDCTKSQEVCQSYGIQAYPTVVLITNNMRFTYKGERNLEPILEFADRLMGPDVHTINDCDQLVKLADEKGIVILSTMKNKSSDLYVELENLATSLKPNWWFYQTDILCDNLVKEEGLYLLKKNLDKTINFKIPPDSQNLRHAIVDWLQSESLPVYGPLNWLNFDRIMETKKLLVSAILDEYKPAKKFSLLSNEFNKLFSSLAKKITKSEDQIIFTWCSELDLIHSIALKEVLSPNVMILNSDLSYVLLLQEPEDSYVKNTTVLPTKFQMLNIEKFISAAKKGQLEFKGGNSMLHQFLRFLFRQYKKIKNVFKADPLLASVLLISPILILIFVIYNTCFTREERNQFKSEDDDESDDEENTLLDQDHAKQE